MKMTCAEIDHLLCDYVDGTLYGEQKSAVAAHLADCANCAELVADARAAVGFVEKCAVVEPPPELMTRLLFELPAMREKVAAERALVPPGWWARFSRRFLRPILQPRFAMGMAMTVLSLAMMGRFAGIEARQLKPADLNPVKVYRTLEDKVAGAWNSTVKYYESLRLVYEIQTRWNEWSEEAERQRKEAPAGQEPAK
jgi:hypothetical protein